MAFPLFLLSVAALLTARLQPLPLLLLSLLPAVCGILALSGFIAPSRRGVQGMLFLAWFVLWWVWGDIQFRDQAAHVVAMPEKSTVLIHARWESKSTLRYGKLQGMARGIGLDRGQGMQPFRDRFWLQVDLGGSSEDGQGGTRGNVRVQGRVMALSPYNPFHERLRLSGVKYQVRVFPGGFFPEPDAGGGGGLVEFALAFRGYFENLLQTAVADPEVRSVLMAMGLGEKGSLEPRTRQVFQELNLMHLLAVSGLHFGLIALFFHASLRACGVPRPLAHLLVIPILAFFLAVVGFPPSANRAFLMICFYFLAAFTGRRMPGLHGVGLAGLILLVLAPGTVWNPGFQLSFAAMTFLLGPGLAVCRAFSEWVRKKKSVLPLRPVEERLAGILEYLGTGLIFSTAAWLGTAPLVLYHFQKIAWIGIFIQGLGVMVLQVVLPLLVLAAILGGVAPLLADLVLQPSTWMVQGFLGGAAWVESLPGMSIPSPGWDAFDVGIAYAILGAAWWIAERWRNAGRECRGGEPVQE